MIKKWFHDIYQSIYHHRSDIEQINQNIEQRARSLAALTLLCLIWYRDQGSPHRLALFIGIAEWHRLHARHHYVTLKRKEEEKEDTLLQCAEYSTTIVYTFRLSQM